MKYNNRAYPHPVLGIDNNINDTFDINLKVSTDSGKICINVTYNLSNSELNKIIKARQAFFCTQLYCKGTLYRETFESFKSIHETIEIESIRLHDLVEMDFFICACKEIPDYTNSLFNDDYKGYSFAIEKGDILAYGGKGNFYANKSPEELKSISAFMNIDTENKNNVPMSNNYDSDKITIILSQNDYELYQRIKIEKLLVNTLHSSVVLPALAEAIRFAKSDDKIDYLDKKWFILLDKLIQANETDDPLQTAQKILELPVNRSFSSLYNDLIK